MKDHFFFRSWYSKLQIVRITYIQLDVPSGLSQLYQYLFSQRECVVVLKNFLLVSSIIFLGIQISILFLTNQIRVSNDEDDTLIKPFIRISLH